MTALDRRLVQDDAIVWQGAPSWRAVARDVYHLRFISAYLAFLVVLDALQAWAKAIPLGKAVHDSVPLAVIITAVLANFYGLAWLTARTTRYTITTRRVILAYGIAIPATLSIPLSRIERIELSPGRDGDGEIALTLAPDDHMPYLKLWPHARPWRLRHPQPMLRGVPQAAIVAGLATRAAEVARRGRSGLGRERDLMTADARQVPALRASAGV